MHWIYKCITSIFQLYAFIRIMHNKHQLIMSSSWIIRLWYVMAENTKCHIVVFLCFYADFNILVWRSVLLTNFPGYLTSGHQCFPQVTDYLSYMISELAARNKWPLEYMSEISSPGEIMPCPGIKPAMGLMTFWLYY